MNPRGVRAIPEQLKPVQTTIAGRVQAPPAKLTHRALALARRIWRRGVRERWQVARGPVLLTIGLGSLILGTIGYLQLTSVTPRYGPLDAVYRAMTLFAFGGAAVPPIPPALQIARICAPLLTGYAAIGAVLALTRDQARVLGIRLFVRDHVVIAGLGATGRRLASALVDHVAVVVIESQVANEHLAGARLRGVRTLTGNASDPKLLNQAGLRHARTLVVVCGAGDANIDVAAAATRSLPARGRPLNIFVHLHNLGLWSSLAAEGATFRSPRSDVRLEYFNAMATGAQLLLERQPPFTEGQHSIPDHLLVVGMDGIAAQLILQLARLWDGHAPGRDAKLWVTIAGATADGDLAALLARYPALAHYLNLDTRPLAIESAAFQSGAAMSAAGARCDVTRAYVSLADEAAALLAALALHARTDAVSVPVTVLVADDGAGVSSVLGSERGRFRAIESFGVLTEATRSTLLLRGTNELLARAQHAQWLRSQQAAGATAAANPNFRAWEDLKDAQRENNRRFADDVHAKLGLVHCMLVPMPLRSPGQAPFEFTEKELETLSRHEHIRWMNVMLAAGWRYGVPRDDAHKIHDQIKPWEQLDEPNRDKDRDAVREIPRMLAAAGFAIQRSPSTERTPSD
jgi:voltage-gated potassium channel Kch